MNSGQTPPRYSQQISRVQPSQAVSSGTHYTVSTNTAGQPYPPVHATQIQTISSVTFNKDSAELRRTLEDTTKRLGLSYMENERLHKENQALKSGSHHTGEVASLRNECNNLRAEISRKAQEANEFRSQLNQLNSQLSSMSAQLGQQQARLDSYSHLERENLRLSSELTGLQRISHGPDATMEDLKNDLTLLANENERLQTQLDHLKSNNRGNDLLSSQLQGLKVDIANLERTNQDLRNAQARLNADLQGKDRTISDLRSQISSVGTLQAELNQVKSQRDLQASQCREKDNTIASLRAQLGSVNTLQAELNQVKSQRDLLISQCREKDNTIASLSAQIGTANVQSRDKDTKISDLLQQLTQKESQTSIKAEIEELKNQVFNKGVAIQDYQKRLADAEHIINAMKVDIVNSECEVGFVKKHLDESQNQLRGLTDVRAKLYNAQLDKENLIKQVENLNMEIESLKQSQQNHSGCTENLQLITEEKAHLSRRLTKAKDIHNTKDREMQDLQLIIAKLTTDMNGLRTNQGVSEAEQALKIAELKSIAGSSEVYEAKIKELNDKINLLNDEIIDLKSTADRLKQLESANSDLSTANTRISELENLNVKLESLVNRVPSLESEISNLQSQLVSKDGENKNLITELNNSNKYNNDQSVALNRLTLDIEAANARYAQLQAMHEKTSQAGNELGRLQTEVLRLTDELSQTRSYAQTESVTMRQAIHNLTREHDDLKAKYNRLVEENGVLSSDLTQARSDIDRLNHNCDLKQNDIEQLRNILDQRDRGTNADMSSLIQESNGYKLRVSHLTDQVNQLQEKLKNAETIRQTEISHIAPFSTLQSEDEPSGIAVDGGKLRLLLIENERLMAKIALMDADIMSLRQTAVERDELLVDLGVVKAAKKKTEDRLEESHQENDKLKLTVIDVTEELKLKCRIIDEKTFMLVDLEKEYAKLKNDNTQTKQFFQQLDKQKAVIEDLEEDNDKLRLEITKLKEEFLFVNQTEISLFQTRRGLDDEKDLSTTKDTVIRTLEDKLTMANRSISSIPLMNQNQQALKDEVFKLQNINQEKDILLYKMRAVTGDMQKEIDTIPKLKLAIENQKADMTRMIQVIKQKDGTLEEFADKLDILKESLSQVVILEEKIKYLEDENKRLNKSLNDRETQIHTFQEGLTDMQRVNKTIPDLQHTTKFLKDELDRVTRQSKEKETLLNSERDRFKSYIEDLQRQNAEYLQQIGDLEKVLRQMKIKEQAAANDHNAAANMLNNKIRELVLALTHVKEENDAFESELTDLAQKLQDKEKELLGLIAVKKERDTVARELENCQNDKKMLSGVISNCQEKITRLEGSITKLRISEIENGHLKEENRALENRVNDMVLQREKITNEVNMSIDQGKMNNYNMQIQIDELKAEVKQLQDTIVFKDREISILKVQNEELMDKLRNADRTTFDFRAKLEDLDNQYKSSQTKLAERDDQLHQALKVVSS